MVELFTAADFPPTPNVVRHPVRVFADLGAPHAGDALNEPIEPSTRMAA